MKFASRQVQCVKVYAVPLHNTVLTTLHSFGQKVAFFAVRMTLSSYAFLVIKSCLSFHVIIYLPKRDTDVINQYDFPIFQYIVAVIFNEGNIEISFQLFQTKAVINNKMSYVDSIKIYCHVLV